MAFTGLIDTHAHLCDAAFASDRAMVIAEARSKGVNGIISVCENLTEAQMNLKLAGIHAEVLPALGLFPTRLDLQEAEKMLALIEKSEQNLAAIGEVGLDFWKVQDEKQRTLQQEIFIQFIVKARELDLPLNVHSRSAGKQVIDLLLKNNASKVQLHAFDAKASSAQPAIEAGYFFSIPPSIVRSEQKQKLVKILPLSSILLESDSPVLGPVPDKRNEPANILLAVKAIAEIKAISEEEVVKVTRYNTDRLYGETKAYKKAAISY